MEPIGSLHLGVNVEAVRRMRGHSSLAVTQGYLHLVGTDYGPASWSRLTEPSKSTVPGRPIAAELDCRATRMPESRDDGVFKSWPYVTPQSGEGRVPIGLVGGSRRMEHLAQSLWDYIAAAANGLQPVAALAAARR